MSVAAHFRPWGVPRCRASYVISSYFCACVPRWPLGHGVASHTPVASTAGPQPGSSEVDDRYLLNK